VANTDERAYVDVHFLSNRRTSNSASSFYLTDSNRRPGLRLQNTGCLTETHQWFDCGETASKRPGTVCNYLYSDSLNSRGYKGALGSNWNLNATSPTHWT